MFDVKPRVVFMANDAVYEQVTAFLESFRQTNPHLLLSMIPFADDVSKIAKLQDVYEFDILDLDVNRWDLLAQEFFPTAEQKYKNRLRKLAIFDLRGSVIIYMDTDVVVLHDVSFLAEPIESGRTDFICTATKDNWVYTKEASQVDSLKNSKRFSDGFFVFNPSSIGRDLAYELVLANKDLYLKVRAADVYSQPLTNFIVDLSQMRVGDVFSFFPNVSPEVWYKSEKLKIDGTRVLANDGKDVLFIHWAGPVEMASEFRMKDLYEKYRCQARNRLQRIGIEP